ncbi:transglutaminase-like domain-containing protein [Algoriphagus confluentis]|uniref:DUF3857 domain-containing protein n=1 Tax=Algoriphagus confluentis TaxID=1697556 RepID=A0ABQ6PV82_9BACT|nr:hypothetical protein Aconfl_41110 [Algoriphagus confluentis]
MLNYQGFVCFFCLFLVGAIKGFSATTPPVYSQLAERQVVTIQADFSVSHEVIKEILILSREGLDHARVVLGYDKLRSIEAFEAEMIHPITQKSILKTKLKDLRDVAQFSQVNIFDDNRLKIYEPTSSIFPVKVKIRYVMKSKTNFALPTWVPIPNYNQKVKEAAFSVGFPDQLGLKYKEVNLTAEKKESLEAGLKTISWIVADLEVQGKDFKKEDDHRLLLAPVRFGLEGVVGEMSDWTGLASWQYQLNKNRDKLPDAFKTQILEMVKDADSDFKKIQILYQYLQKNYRYVSIQLGIGGWQTQLAAEVYQNKFGDCKGLTNLMKAMLAEVGIESYYTLVYAGSNADDIEVDLPSNQFNHVILQVPSETGPIWLECTSSTLPAGYLGEFTKGRHVLVVREKGGYLTQTPSYTTESWNTLSSKNKIKIDQQGNAAIESEVSAQGNFAVTLTDVKFHLDTRQQRDFLNRNSGVSGLLVNDFQIDLHQEDSLPKAKLAYDGAIIKFVQSTAKRHVLKSFLGKITEDQLAFSNLFKTEEYEIQLPEPWQSESQLPQVDLKEEHFTASLHSRLDRDRLSISILLQVRLPEEFSAEEKTNLVKRINSTFDYSLLFLKTPSPSTIINP